MKLAIAGLAVLAVLVSAGAASAADRTPPTAPTNVRVTGVAEDSLTFSWNAATDNSGRIQRYVVHYDGYGLYHSGSSTTKTLTGLVPSFTRTVRIQAFDFAGNASALSAPASGTTLPDTTPPTTPGNFRVTGTTPSSVAVAWDRATDRWGVGYTVLMDGDAIGGTGNQAFRRRHLEPGSTHTFTVRARDAAGNLSAPSNGVTVTLADEGDRTPPAAPRNLVASTPPDDFCGSNVLRWEPATDDRDAAAAIEYELYRNGSFFDVTAPGATSAFVYTDAGTNTWTVVAVDRHGNSSAPSNAATVTVRVDVALC